MADAKISELTEKTDALVDTDLFVIVDSGVVPNTTKKIQASNVLRRFVVGASKNTVGTIAAGKAVYIAGFDTINQVISVELADASSSSSMPAYGIAVTEITDSIPGSVIIYGDLDGQNTSSYSVGDALYISETAGELTNAKPDGTALIQKIGVVAKSDATAGVIQVFGAGRSNDLPNLAEGKVWVGDANGVPQQDEYVNRAFLQYSVATQQSTNTTLDVPIVTNRSSYPNSRLTKVNDTDFRTDYAGQVLVEYSFSAWPDANDRGWSISIIKNGTKIDWTERFAEGLNTANRNGHVGGSFILDCAVNDVFKFRLTSVEGADVTVEADRASASLRFYR